MMFLGLFLFIPVLYFILRRPADSYYSGSHTGCCASDHDMHDNMNRSDASKARAILDSRYARGEISDDEYKTKKANLG
jgi:uncharacterized membrane protein